MSDMLNGIINAKTRRIKIKILFWLRVKSMHMANTLNGFSAWCYYQATKDVKV